MAQILSPSAGSREWLWHVWGADSIIATARFEDHDCVDTDVLIDWAYYHKALAVFAVQHWRDKSLMHKSISESRVPGSTMKTRRITVGSLRFSSIKVSMKTDELST